MKSITFTCEVITPMFLAGADGSTPELRPASIKGALRFWWRAMNGGLVSWEQIESDYSDLLATDESIFGGTQKNKTRSTVQIRVQELNDKPIDGYGIQSAANANGGRNGLGYLLYSIIHHKLKDKGFDNGKKFNVIFSSSENHFDELLKSIAAFWLLVHFGSLGTRARRGAGAFKVVSIEDVENLLENKMRFSMNPDESITDYFKSNFAKVKVYIGSDLRIPFKEYSQLSDAPVFLSKEGFGSWHQVIDVIGMQMKGVRTGKTSRNKSERTFTQETLDQKAAFGLPVGVFSDNSVTFEKHERRASPIYITVIFNNLTNKYHWVVTHLQGKFMPVDDKIIFTSKNPKVWNKDHSWELEDDRLVKSFINRIKNISQKII
jgi:CRISPR-associated protein Cmr1